MFAALRQRLRAGFFRWALRVRPPEAAPIIIRQRRVYVLPTRAGIAFAATLGIMLIGAINYNLSLGYGLVFLLAGLGIVTILHTFHNLLMLEIRPGRSEPVFAGELAQFTINLGNPRRKARRALRLRLGEEPYRSTDVPAHGSTHIQLSYPARQRGWLPMPRMTISTSYPLGLIRAWSYSVPDQRCLVYPQPIPSAPPLPQGEGSGVGKHSISPEMDDFHGLRTFQNGEPLRQVAWKAVARQDSDTWLSKQFTGEQAPSLWLDWNNVSGSRDDEERIAILTRWVLDAEASGARWGLRLPGLELPLDHGKAHMHICLQALALVEGHRPAPHSPHEVLP